MKKNILIIILVTVIALLISYIVYDHMIYHKTESEESDSCSIS